MMPTIGADASAPLGLVAENQLFVARPPWWPAARPSPEVTAAVLLGMLVFAAVAAVLVVRIVVPSGVQAGRVLSRIWRRITPESTFGKVMVTFSLLLVVVSGATMFTLVDAKGAIENVNSGPGDTTEVDGDVIGYVDGSVADRPVVPRPTPDRDGDRLRDDWERAGETPDGVPLPDASVGRKDVYLQILYGSEIEPLDSAERRELQRIWAEMPVENPDGSTGISLHFVDERRLDSEVKTASPEEIVLDRYDRAHLGRAKCVYYQTTFGDFEGSARGGYAIVGEHVSVVDGTKTTVRDGRTDRTVVLTHELLHNTAGLVEWRTHTDEGWLSTNDLRRNDHLSPATAASLESGFVRYAYEDQPTCPTRR
jgi:hypothetical protein